jgi:hypothetical protein
MPLVASYRSFARARPVHVAPPFLGIGLPASSRDVPVLSPDRAPARYALGAPHRRCAARTLLRAEAVMDPIWLDVPTKRAFESEILDRDKALITHPGIQALYVQLIQYHQIQKAQLAQFPRRVVALRDLSKRATLVPLPAETWIRDWIKEWIVEQAQKKANYLEILQQYFRDNDSEVRDPKDLLDQLKAPRAVVSMPLKPAHQGSSTWKQARPGETLIGMHGGVQLERKDPLHRVYEFRMQGDNITGVTRQQEVELQYWAAEVRAGRCKEPFFVHLESTECCLVRNTNRETHLGIQEFPGVKYVSGGNSSAGIYQVGISNGLAFTIRSNGYGGYFDTDHITEKDSPKGTRDERHGRKTMAYNWTRHAELLVGLHKEYEVHHSTFQSGGLIRCAGMIGARAGKIYWIDNDSGHYRPPPANLHVFVKCLKAQGVLAPDARVFNAAAREGSIQKQVTGMNVEQYLANPSGQSFSIGGHRAQPSTTPRLGGHRGT